ncbi:MAG: hypothetical protein M1829_004317 [Trizodia sp. TS-e1964]|nr:MAG: hypothetical protein M1829_004317 [Trizodia sp. TS-e1964]
MLELSYLQKAKNAAHIFQTLLIFIVWAITIAVLRGDGSTDGRSKWYFAVVGCWLSLPALIYVAMVPAWPRSQKFANAYAFAVIDTLFTIFWFSAFIAVASWNSSGIQEGARALNIDENAGNCSTFAYGPQNKCDLSKATVGLGVIILENGTLISVAPKQHDPESIEAQTKDAFSTAAHDEQYDDDGTHTERGGDQEGDEFALLHGTESEDGRNTGKWRYDDHHDGHQDGHHGDHQDSGDYDDIDTPPEEGHFGHRPLSGGGHFEEGFEHPPAAPHSDLDGRIQFPNAADYSYHGAPRR